LTPWYKHKSSAELENFLCIWFQKFKTYTLSTKVLALTIRYYYVIEYLARISNCIDSYTTHYIFTENLGNILKPLKNLIEKFAKKVNAVETKVEKFYLYVEK
jgi:predicted P-loop ATPase/GTPase